MQIQTQSEYVILEVFPLQQRLQEHAAVLHDTYIAFLIMIVVCITILICFLHHLHISSVEYVRFGF